MKVESEVGEVPSRVLSDLGSHPLPLLPPFVFISR
jgi:hypothetical protein